MRKAFFNFVGLFIDEKRESQNSANLMSWQKRHGKRILYDKQHLLADDEWR